LRDAVEMRKRAVFKTREREREEKDRRRETRRDRLI
jgi:hypothetical protein